EAIGLPGTGAAAVPPGAVAVVSPSTSGAIEMVVASVEGAAGGARLVARTRDGRATLGAEMTLEVLAGGSWRPGLPVWVQVDPERVVSF
ncbi:MAG: hypothetical protein WEA81_08020, partial [Dehalococcoidia bacterium]